MRVLFTISSLGSGGAERVLTTLANHWIKDGWEITIVTIFSNKFYEIDSKIEWISLQDRKKFFKPISNIRYIREIIKEKRPDIIISFMTQVSIYSIVASLKLNIPIIISERTYYGREKSRMKLLLKYIIYPLTDGMVLLSKEDYLHYDRVKSKKIIFNPLKFNSNFSNLKFENREKIILSVGSLREAKGFDMLIEALSQIDMRDWISIIIGEGENRDSLEELIRRKGLQDRVFLIGRRDDVFSFYEKASIFVLSSRYEGFPNVLVEAMAHGCAVVAFDCKTGPSTIIEDGVNGYLVEANNISKLSEKIDNLIVEESIREEFFNKSIDIRDRLKLDKISNEWKNYIYEIINME